MSNEASSSGQRSMGENFRRLQANDRRRTRLMIANLPRRSVLQDPEIRRQIFQRLTASNLGRAAVVSRNWAHTSKNERERVSQELKRLVDARNAAAQRLRAHRISCTNQKTDLKDRLDGIREQARRERINVDVDGQCVHLIYALRHRPDVIRLMEQRLAARTVLSIFVDVADDYFIERGYRDAQTFMGRRPSMFLLDKIDEYFRDKQTLDACLKTKRTLHGEFDKAVNELFVLANRLHPDAEDEVNSLNYLYNAEEDLPAITFTNFAIL